MESRALHINEEFKKVNWIPVYRQLLGWEWYHSSHMVHLWIHLLLRANINNSRWRGIKVKRGQLITGRLQLCRETGMKESIIRTALKNLQKSGEITIKTTKQYSLITIIKYDCYQFSKNPVDQQNSQQSTREITKKPPSINQKIATYNKVDRLIKKEEKTSDNLQLDEENSGLMNSIIQEFVRAYEEYHDTKYHITNIEDEKKAAKKLMQLINNEWESDLPSPVEVYREFFKVCVSIRDPWLHDNMSLAIIVKKFNSIKLKLVNGKAKQKTGTGASGGDIANIVLEKFSTKE